MRWKDGGDADVWQVWYADKFLRKQNYFLFEASSEDGRKASDEYTYVWVSKLSSQFPTLTGCGQFLQNHSTGPAPNEFSRQFFER